MLQSASAGVSNLLDSLLGRCYPVSHRIASCATSYRELEIVMLMHRLASCATSYRELEIVMLMEHTM